MENFILWGASTDGDRLTFFATRMQLPRIQDGSTTMLEKMLTDLGVEPRFSSWSIASFKTNKYATPDDDLHAADTWIDTWRIEVGMTLAIDTTALARANGLEILRTFARDDTWDGSETVSPAKYVLACRLYSDQARELLNSALEAVRRVDPPDRSDLDPDLADLVESIRNHPFGKLLQREQLGNEETGIALGTHVEGALPLLGDLAGLVTALIRELAGTTTWDEAAEVLVRQVP